MSSDKLSEVSEASGVPILREVRLVFANYENAPKINLSISTDATVKDLKLQLLAVWPKDEVPACDDLSRIRLICKCNTITCFYCSTYLSYILYRYG
jgi:hypothetical protein